MLFVAVCLAVVWLGGWADGRSWRLAFESLRLSAAVCAISVPVGTVLAFLIVRTDLPARVPLAMLLGGMLFVPLYLQAGAWQSGFGSLGWFTLVTHSSFVWLDGWRGAVWVHAMSCLPWVVLVVSTGLWFVEPELEEEALLDLSAPQVFAHVTLWRALPSVAVAALWVVVSTAGEMTATDLFLVRTYAEELYTQLAIGGEPGQAALAVMPGVLITACLVAGGLVVCARVVPRSRTVTAGPRWVFRLGRWRWFCLALVVCIVIAVVGLPVGSLCYKAGVSVTRSGDDFVRGWSAVKCLQTVNQAFVGSARELERSIEAGVLAATAAVACGVPLAWLGTRGRSRSTSTLFVTALLLALPGPVVGLLIIHVFNFRALAYLQDRTIAPLWLALYLRALPLVTLVLWYALRSVSSETLESATVEGAGVGRRLWSIVVPQRLPAIGLAWVIALAVALGDLAASVLVAPAGMMTLSIHIFNSLHYGVQDRVAGDCLALLAIIAALTLVGGYLARRTIGRSEPGRGM